MRRVQILSLSTVAIVGLLFSTNASAAAPTDMSGFVPDFTQEIPFLAEGASTTVGGVEVTATINTGIVGDGPYTYLHQSIPRVHTLLTFDKPIPGFRAQIRLNDDCPDEPTAPPDCFEDYHIVGRDDAGNVVLDKSVRNEDVTMSIVPGNGTDEISEPIATLEFDYTFDTQVYEYLRGSYLNIWLTDTYLEPASQTVTGKAGNSISSTKAFDAVGFAGEITYSITDGKLPAGLNLNPNTGEITGTPTKASSATVTITATGATRGEATATVTFDIQDADVLANTGANGQIGLFGVAALLFGAMLVLVASRRRATPLIA